MVLAKTDADAEIQIAMNSRLSLAQKLGTKPVTLKIDHIPPIYIYMSTLGPKPTLTQSLCKKKYVSGCCLYLVAIQELHLSCSNKETYTHTMVT